MKKITFILLLLATNAWADIIHVPADYPTIQQGINAAKPGDTVLVADGIYYEQIIISKQQILVTSNFLFDADSTHLLNTIIDGKYLQRPNQTVVYFKHADTTSILAGFTIQNGKGTRFGSTVIGGGIKMIYSGAKIIHNRIINNVLNGKISINSENAVGAAIAAPHCSNSWLVMSGNLIQGNKCYSDNAIAIGAGGYICIDTRLANNIIKDNLCRGLNSCSAEGAGFCIEGTDVPVTLIASSNKFINNMARGEESSYVLCGGLLTRYSINTIADNEFIGNIAFEGISNSSGAITLIQSQGPSIIRGNIFTENKADVAGAILVDYNSESISIESNRFNSNEAKYKGGAISINTTGYVFLQNNVFKNNIAILAHGGAVMIEKTGSQVPADKFVNNSFSGNSAGKHGGAVATQNANPLFLNNIFWNNDAQLGEDLSVRFGHGYFAYGDIDQTKIEGNITLLDGLMNCNPVFCDSNCLLIGMNSPCRDAGAESFAFPEYGTVFAPAFDINGNKRPWFDGYDLGANECSLAAVSANGNKSDNDMVVYPNPFNNILNCKYRLDKETKVVINLYDLLGRSVLCKSYDQQAGEYDIPVNMKDLNNGIYIIKIKAGVKEMVKKVIHH